MSVRDDYSVHPTRMRYDILVGCDWRMKLDARDRGVLKPVLEVALIGAGSALLQAIGLATNPTTAALWPEQAYVLARRAHRYARILEVIS